MHLGVSDVNHDVLVRIAVTGTGTPEQKPAALPHQPVQLTEKGSRENKN